jgi:hypothetical protein
MARYVWGRWRPPVKPPAQPTTSPATIYVSLKSGQAVSGIYDGKGVQKYGVLGEYSQDVDLGPIDIRGYSFAVKLAGCENVTIHDYVGRENVMSLHMIGCRNCHGYRFDLKQKRSTKNDHCLYLDKQNADLELQTGILIPTSGYGIHAFSEDGSSSGLIVDDYSIDATSSTRGPVIMARWSNWKFLRMKTKAKAGMVHYRLYGTVHHGIIEGEAWGGDALVSLVSGTGFPSDIVVRNFTYHGQHLTPGDVPIPGVTFEPTVKCVA